MSLRSGLDGTFEITPAGDKDTHRAPPQGPRGRSASQRAGGGVSAVTGLTPAQHGVGSGPRDPGSLPSRGHAGSLSCCHLRVVAWEGMPGGSRVEEAGGSRWCARHPPGPARWGCRTLELPGGRPYVPIVGPEPEPVPGPALGGSSPRPARPAAFPVCPRAPPANSRGARASPAVAVSAGRTAGGRCTPSGSTAPSCWPWRRGHRSPPRSRVWAGRTRWCTGAPCGGAAPARCSGTASRGSSAGPAGRAAGRAAGSDGGSGGGSGGGQGVRGAPRWAPGPGLFRLAQLEPLSKSLPPVALWAQGHLLWSLSGSPQTELRKFEAVPTCRGRSLRLCHCPRLFPDSAFHLDLWSPGQGGEVT